MKLDEIAEKLKTVRQDSRDLDWQMALYKANLNYRTHYIEGLSLNYRKTCAWWIEIGDDLVEYYKKNPIGEARLKKWYFENRSKNH